ncbi:hypothetical protein ONS96_004952 [Cadophora gregata f. sp. sojae]|nr:hypothetical protein ONS96_004952 [Cadophora gregata f. sp. sojae]
MAPDATPNVSLTNTSHDKTIYKVPGSSIVLQKKSIMAPDAKLRLELLQQEDKWEWAVLLKERGSNGALSRATEIDSRVGCVLDGAIVYYEDGHKTPCGPRTNRRGGRKHRFGGLASERFPIPPGDEITKVEIGVESYMLNGLRFHMSGGTSGGHLDENTPVHTLEPSPGHKIVGFYGWSRWGQIFNEVMEFGIITAPGDINDLPEIIYDMPELRNSNGGNADAGDVMFYDSDGGESVEWIRG